jgi:hypothetical protein
MQRHSSRRRSRSRERIGKRGHDSGKKVRWITSNGDKYTLCFVNADEVPEELLRAAKNIASSVLNLDGRVAEHIVDFPHDLDGGWRDVHPEDAFVVYGQIWTGQFAGVAAVATGSQKEKRERGLALALVLAAAATQAEKMPDWQQFQPELENWVQEATLQWFEKNEAKGSDRTNRRAELGGDRDPDEQPTEVEALRKELRAAELKLAGARAEAEEARAESRRSLRLEKNAMHLLRINESGYEQEAADAVKELHEAELSLRSERDLADKLMDHLRQAEEKLQKLELGGNLTARTHAMR